MRARWARDDFDQLQPTAPGLLYPLTHLAMAQGATCGARETELQVRALTLTVHRLVSPRITTKLTLLGTAHVTQVCMIVLQGFSSVGVLTIAGGKSLDQSKPKAAEQDET